MTDRQGPLKGIRIVEMTGIGPVPYAAMLMADMGAEVIRIDRPGGYPAIDPSLDFAAMEAASVFYRSRPMVKLDVKSEAGREALMRLIASADAVIEGYRPGTMERLGLGPEEAFAQNPRLAYVRVTGWGQEGPLARTAGHDLNYVALSGALSLFGQHGAPPQGVPPLVGDMAGGALFGVIGLLAAVLSARTTGQGQVVDTAIVDGTASLYTLLTALAAMGAHGAPGTNPLDGGRHYYRTYACTDGHVAVGAIEPAFRKVLLERLGLLDDARFTSGLVEDDSYCTDRLAAIFAARSRAEWEALFAGSDGCVTAVLSPGEAAADPRNTARELFAEIEGVTQASPAPRFSTTPGTVQLPAGEAAQAKPDALHRWGFAGEEIEALLEAGALER